MLQNKILKSVLALLIMFTCLSGCSKQETKVDPKGMSYFDFFDTVSFIYSYTNDDMETFQKKCDKVADILEQYHKYFDIYYEYEGVNNLYTLNANAGIKAVEMDDELIEFLLKAKELYYLTNGKTNVMLGAVTKLWHDERTAATNNKADAKLPDFNLLSEANKHVDIDLLVIDKENKTAFISDPEARIDVGAYGKGYAAERAAEYLYDIKAYGYVLNIGGNIRTIGSKMDGSAWTTGIKDPADLNRFALRINIKDIACVTSGVYERYYTVDGKKYHHIVDPLTLYPAEYFDSVSILTKDSGLADGLSTAFACMSYEEGMKLADTLGVDVIWIFKDGTVKYTPNVENLIIGG
ncbi:MAG: FAD:protein FMN transferase [Erysipelotrichaceae bacterium]|nr:FAD:protein FMN transferase [Erysipelotrichaceae bacterium]